MKNAVLITVKNGIRKVLFLPNCKWKGVGLVVESPGFAGWVALGDSYMVSKAFCFSKMDINEPRYYFTCSGSIFFASSVSRILRRVERHSWKVRLPLVVVPIVDLFISQDSVDIKSISKSKGRSSGKSWTRSLLQVRTFHMILKHSR